LLLRSPDISLDLNMLSLAQLVPQLKGLRPQSNPGVGVYSCYRV
jgi:hypothetical protein